MKNRQKVGIVIDYTLRFPEFVTCYNQMKKEILEGEMSKETEVNSIEVVYFKDLSKTCKEAYDFYLHTPTPEYDDRFDYTFKKYFFSKKDLDTFLELWSFNLYSSANLLEKINVDFINVTQSQLCDVVLIDKTSCSRKIPNTLVFLSKSRTFFKELVFVKSDVEMKELKKDFLALYDPIEQFKGKEIAYSLKDNKLLKWLKEVESKLSENKIVEK